MIIGCLLGPIREDMLRTIIRALGTALHPAKTVSLGLDYLRGGWLSLIQEFFFKNISQGSLSSHREEDYCDKISRILGDVLTSR